MNRIAAWGAKFGLARNALRQRRPGQVVDVQGPYYQDASMSGGGGAQPAARRRWFRTRHYGETPTEYWLDVTHKLAMAHRTKLFAALATLVLLLVLLLLVDVFASRSERAARGAAVHSALAEYPPRIAESFALYTPAAPLRAAAGQLQYAQLRGELPPEDGSNLERTMAAASALLAAANGSEPCACAPMFGARVSHIALQRGDKVRHLFNVRDAARAAFDNAARVGELGSLSLVAHTHDHLFDWPGHDAPRALHVVRRDALTLAVTSLAGIERTLTLRNREAHCACACIDLINGVTLWERALRQEPLLGEAQGAELAYAARVQKLLTAADTE